MAEPFSFLDKIDRFLDGPVSVLMETQARVREMALDLDAPQVRKLAMAVVLERLKDPLAEAIYDHMLAVQSEFEVLEGELAEADDYGPWYAALKAAIVASFAGSDVEAALGSARAVDDALGDACSSDRLAEAVLAVPVDDPAAVLARVGVTDAAVDALVAEIGAKQAQEPQELDYAGEKLPVGSTRDPQTTADHLDALLFCETWSLEVLRSVAWLRLDAGDDPEVVREAAGYALAESDEDLWFTACEILQVPEPARAGFLQWVAERAAFSTPEQDQADLAEVMRAASIEEGSDSHQTGAEPEAVRSPETAGHMTSAGAKPEKPAPAEHPKQRPVAPVASPKSALTDAVAGALTVLYEMTRETDTHMAEVLGTTKAVVNQARKGVTPWAPDGDQMALLRGLVHKYASALDVARGSLTEDAAS